MHRIEPLSTDRARREAWQDAFRPQQTGHGVRKASPRCIPNNGGSQRFQEADGFCVCNKRRSRLATAAMDCAYLSTVLLYIYIYIYLGHHDSAVYTLFLLGFPLSLFFPSPFSPSLSPKVSSNTSHIEKLPPHRPVISMTHHFVFCSLEDINGVRRPP